MFELNAKIVIFSHLSDAQENVSMGNSEMANKHINFVKFIIQQSGDNLYQVFEEDKLNEM